MNKPKDRGLIDDILQGVGLTLGFKLATYLWNLFFSKRSKVLNEYQLKHIKNEFPSRHLRNELIEFIENNSNDPLTTDFMVFCLSIICMLDEDQFDKLSRYSLFDSIKSSPHYAGTKVDVMITSVQAIENTYNSDADICVKKLLIKKLESSFTLPSSLEIYLKLFDIVKRNKDDHVFDYDGEYLVNFANGNDSVGTRIDPDKKYLVGVKSVSDNQRRVLSPGYSTEVQADKAKMMKIDKIEGQSAKVMKGSTVINKMRSGEVKVFSNDIKSILSK